MNCDTMEGRIAEFLAGETPHHDRAAVQQHLMDCAGCRGQFNLAKLAWDAAQDVKAGAPSEALQQRTKLAVRADGVITPFHRGTLRALRIGTLAAAGLVAFLAVSSIRPLPTTVRVGTAEARRTAAASPGLATLAPSLGQLFVKDENGKPAGELSIRRLTARVDINDGIARTEIEEVFFNASGRRLEGTFLFPLPPDASISRLAMEINGKLMEGEVVEREKARQTYEGIVRRMEDPALLEWMPGGIFKCRIFPIEATSEKRIIIAYTQALPYFDGHYRYVYPLAGESASEKGIGRFEFETEIRAGTKIVSATSMSHDAKMERVGDNRFKGTFAENSYKPKRDIVLDIAVETGAELTTSVHRSADQGYFTLFVTPRADGVELSKGPKKLLFLIDASASITGPELEVAKKLVTKMIESLGPEDTFRIAGHNLSVTWMDEAVHGTREGRNKADEFLSKIRAMGACDLERALRDILPVTADGTEIVYIGEGTPTLGETDTAKLVALGKSLVETRAVTIRTVAVGSDADRPLLQTLSREFNGGAHQVSPSDDVNARVAEISRTLGRSALNDLKVEFEGLVTDVAPAKLGSIHFGERLMISGRYGQGAIKMVLTGKVHGRVVRREFPVTLPETQENLFARRLWAQRRLADMVSQGAAARDAAVKLSVEYQVMTPYTSFLVLENEQAYKDHQISRTKKDSDAKDPSKVKLEESKGATDKESKQVLEQAERGGAPRPPTTPAKPGDFAREQPAPASDPARPRAENEDGRELARRNLRDEAGKAGGDFREDDRDGERADQSLRSLEDFSKNVDHNESADDEKSNSWGIQAQGGEFRKMKGDSGEFLGYVSDLEPQLSTVSGAYDAVIETEKLLKDSVFNLKSRANYGGRIAQLKTLTGATFTVDKGGADANRAKASLDITPLQQQGEVILAALAALRRTDASPAERELIDLLAYASGALPRHLSASMRDAERRMVELLPLYGEVAAKDAFAATMKRLMAYHDEGVRFFAKAGEVVSKFDRETAVAALVDIRKAWTLVDAASKAASIDSVGSVTAAGDQVTFEVRLDSLVLPNDTLVVTRNGQFVAVVRIDKIETGKAFGRIYGKMAVGTLSAGDAARRIHGDRDLWNALPESIQNDILSRSSLDSVRSTMRALREMKEEARP